MRRAGPQVASRSLRQRSQRSRSVEYSVERQRHARSRLFAMAANAGGDPGQLPRPQWWPQHAAGSSRRGCGGRRFGHSQRNIGAVVCRCQDCRIEPGCQRPFGDVGRQQCFSGAGRQGRGIGTRREDRRRSARRFVAVPAQTKVATPAKGAKPTAAGKQTSPANSNDPIANVANAVAGSPAEVTDGQPWNGSSAPQAQTRADGDTIMPVQSGGSAATHVDALAATPASEAGSTGLAQLLH